MLRCFAPLRDRPLSNDVDRHSRENPLVSRNLQVATVLDQLHKFLGPELKAVTGESAGIDEIMDRVEGLALPLNKVISQEHDEYR